MSCKRRGRYICRMKTVLGANSSKRQASLWRERQFFQLPATQAHCRSERSRSCWRSGFLRPLPVQSAAGVPRNSKELNFEFVAVSDIWDKRREEGKAQISKLARQAHRRGAQQRRAIRSQRCRRCDDCYCRFSACSTWRGSGSRWPRCLCGKAHGAHDERCARHSPGG